MIKQKEMKIKTTAKSANTKANGANIEKKEKMPNKNQEHASPRKLQSMEIITFPEPNSMDGGNLTIHSPSDTIRVECAREPSSITDISHDDPHIILSSFKLSFGN